MGLLRKVNYRETDKFHSRILTTRQQCGVQFIHLLIAVIGLFYIHLAATNNFILLSVLLNMLCSNLEPSSHVILIKYLRIILLCILSYTISLLAYFPLLLQTNYF